MGYYDLLPGTPVSEVVRRWREQHAKAYDESMPQMYSAEELWPYREYTRTQSSGNLSADEWDTLAERMRATGWLATKPAHVYIFKRGRVQAKVGEGNHRLSIARQLGIPVPVWFHFVHENPPNKEALTTYT